MRGLLRGRWNLWTWRNWKREDELRFFACERGTSARFHTRSVCTCEARLHLFTGTGCVFCVLCSNDRSGGWRQTCGGGGYRYGEEREAKESKAGREKSYSQNEVEREEEGTKAESGAQAGGAQETRSPDAGRGGQPERGDRAVEASRARGGRGRERRGFWRRFRG